MNSFTVSMPPSQIERGHHSLVDVFERGMQAAPARAPLGAAEDDEIGEAELIGHLGERLAGHERHLDAGEPAFVDFGEPVEGGVCHDGA
jgi:hypothetical protein